MALAKADREGRLVKSVLAASISGCVWVITMSVRQYSQ